MLLATSDTEPTQHIFLSLSYNIGFITSSRNPD